MMYLCQFGQNLAIGSEDRVQTRLFIEWYDPGDIEIQVKVTKILSFLKVLLIMYLCQFCVNLPIGSEDLVLSMLFQVWVYDPCDLEN